MPIALAGRPASWDEGLGRRRARTLASRTVTLSTVELQKLRDDHAELIIRMVRPVLWLLIFGQIFSQVSGIPTGGLSYLAYLTPGILAQSALFVAIFFGIHIIWDRDSGVLTKVMATPTPRQAITAAKAFAAGVRGLSPVVVLLPVAALLGVTLTAGPLQLLAAYPIDIMPSWLQVVSWINPLTNLVDALRGCSSERRPTCGSTSLYWAGRRRAASSCPGPCWVGWCAEPTAAGTPGGHDQPLGTRNRVWQGSGCRFGDHGAVLLPRQCNR